MKKSLIAENVKRIIKEQGLKQQYVAKKGGYSERAFTDFMHSRRVITEHDILIFSYILNVTPNDLYGISTKDKKSDIQNK